MDLLITYGSSPFAVDDESPRCRMVYKDAVENTDLFSHVRMELNSYKYITWSNQVEGYQITSVGLEKLNDANDHVLNRDIP